MDAAVARLQGAHPLLSPRVQGKEGGRLDWWAWKTPPALLAHRFLAAAGSPPSQQVHHWQPLSACSPLWWPPSAGLAGFVPPLPVSVDLPWALQVTP